MTNTDTADVAGTVAQVRRCRRRQRAGARHGQQRGGGRARSPRSSALEVGSVPDHRRLPLQRPPAAHQVSRLRRGAGQVPHQSRQRRRQAPRRELPRHHRGRHRQRQAGAHRRQLGLPRPAPAHRDDGRQRAAGRAARRARRHHGRHGRERAPLGRAGRGRPACRHDRIILSAKVSGVQDLVDVYRMLAARVRLPAPPRPHRGGHGHEGHRGQHRRRWRSCCRRASATPSASRSRRSPAATAPRKCRWRSRSCSRSGCAASRRR